MSEFADIIKYLADNLEINISQVVEFGPVEMIKVELSLGGTVISESDCQLPDSDEGL